RLDLARWGYGFTARFDCRSVRHIAPESPSKLAFVVGVDLGIVAADKANAVRLRALVFRLRYSGLRIRDAVTLSRNRIQDHKLFLYTAKTGTAVYCPLPPFVVKALDAIPASTYFFWTGLAKPKSAVGDWQRSLKRLLILAGVPDGHAHRFRDTFSVELLLAGVPIERVSILLGHQSVRITEKHYAPWVRARQEQLEADVRRTWQTHEPQQGVHGGYTEKHERVIPLKSRRKNGGGGGESCVVPRSCGVGLLILHVTLCRILHKVNHMPTNLAIDDRLIEEARKLGRHRTKKDAVTAALDKYIRRRKQQEILPLFGTMDYDEDYD